VLDYYALLPEDTRTAWSYLGPDARASAGGYGRYRGFWSAIDDVTVGGTTLEGDVVTAELTYGSDGSTQTEERRLRLTRTDSGWLIAEDLGT
jgi:hypothetical protein